jgi:hypothetical protein
MGKQVNKKGIQSCHPEINCAKYQFKLDSIRTSSRQS